MKKPRYSMNLTKAQWKVIKSFLPQERPGRPARCRHAVLNALWYMAVTGVQWRHLPREYPPRQTVYYAFQRYCRLGLWKRVHQALRALVREKMNCHKHPTSGCLDSQSVKTTAVAGVRGYDSGKKVKGRKRHLLCDTQGLALELVVTPASVSNSQGARLVFGKTGRRRNVTKSQCHQVAMSPSRNVTRKLRRAWVDAGYKKRAIEWCGEKRGVTLEVVTKDKDQSGFVLQKRRWAVERTFSWLSAHRRLVRDYEGCIAHSEALIWIALSRILLKRLA